LGKERPGMIQKRLAALRGVKRVVIKIGSSLLTGSSAQGLRMRFLGSLARQLKALSDRGITPLVVTSGAIAAGLHEMGLSRKPKEIPKLQALAAVGQTNLMQAYDKAFAHRGLKVAQLLLTREDLAHKARYANARNTLAELLKNGIVPVINENDTVAVEEIKFGDNDTLSGLVTHLADADLLVILTDLDGLYDRDPRKDRNALLIRDVLEWDSSLERAAGGSQSLVGTGGMASKVRTARRMCRSGHPMVILGGDRKDSILKLFNGEAVGTFFHAGAKRMHAQDRWLAWGAEPKAGVAVDEGAQKALLEGGKSLLASGVKSVRGHWDAGEVIRIENGSGREIARGVCGYSSSETDRIKGLKTPEAGAVLGRKAPELVHRDHLVLMEDL